MSVTRGQCDARPAVTFPAARLMPSMPSIGWYQIILLGDKGTRVLNNLPRVTMYSGSKVKRVKSVAVRYRNVVY